MYIIMMYDNPVIRPGPDPPIRPVVPRLGAADLLPIYSRWRQTA
jgi:hypothetical protein